ncbi:MAG: acyl-CoA dehydrogenase family protein [Steroidobacteraceae bacterium]
MNFELSDEQRTLRDAIARFLGDKYKARNEHGAARSKSVSRRESWQSLADELGLLGVGFDERLGGVGGGAIEHMIVMEAFGQALIAEPYLETIVVAGSLLQRSRAPWAADMIHQIIAGDTTFGAAFMEPHTRLDLASAATRATRQGADYIVEGHKAVVVGAPEATHLLLTARTGGSRLDRHGVSVFVVDGARPGLRRRNYTTIDGRSASEIYLDKLRLPSEALLFDEGAALPFLEQAVDEAIAAICGEAVGVMQRLLQNTVTYTGQRRQFGHVLADFQVLQHRMADMFVMTEHAAAIALFAAESIAQPAQARAAGVSAAKAYIGRALRMIGQSAVQLHGGMGMTNELEVGRLFKRATVIERIYGCTEDHLLRYSEIGHHALI